jgi:hypothetical protein
VLRPDDHRVWALEHPPRELHGSPHTANRRDGARAEIPPAHDAGAEFDTTVRIENRAAPGVGGAVALHRGDGDLDAFRLERPL